MTDVLAQRTRALACAIACAIAALACAGVSVAIAATPRVDLTDPEQRLETYIRAVGDTSGREVAEYATATVFAVVPGEKAKPLFDFEVLGVGRYEKIEGGWLRLSRELGFYLDPKTREPLRRWFNPYLQREVEVVPVMNDPVNRRFTVQGSSFNVLEDGNEVIFHREVPLRYRNPLDPLRYPLYSSGEYYEAMEMFQNFLSRRDIENKRLTSLPARGSWTRIGPWLPWMEMGARPGYLVYHSRSVKPANGLEGVPRRLRDLVASENPKFLRAPERFEEPDQTSWTVFRDLIDARRATAAAATTAGGAGAGASANAPTRMPGTVFRDCEGCPQLVVIPAGRFDMGSPDGEQGRPETPIHEVRLTKPFALGRTEVTIAQFKRFLDATGYAVQPGCRIQERSIGPRGRIEWKDDPKATWRTPGTLSPLTDEHPIVCVGRVDALAYVEWLARTTGQRYRLPTEAEWEYAARAGASGLYPWGGNADLGCTDANVYDRASRAKIDFGWGFADCDDGYAELAPVGRLKPNAFGLHDVIGNVWEWTQDCYVEGYANTPRDGSAQPPPAQGECKLWSVRGGGWMTRPSRQRLTFRGRDPNDTRNSYFGIRVARDL